MPISQLFSPTFSWHAVPSPEDQQARLSKSTIPPDLPWLWPRFIRLLVGKLHIRLLRFSKWYCRKCNIQFSGQIAQLPFGLISKYSDGTRLEEVAAMHMARRAGLPVPFVVAYGEHPSTPHAPLSILMTRMPGKELFKDLWDWYNEDDQKLLCDQLRSFLKTIRQWTSNSVCIRSPLNTTIRSTRIPRHHIGPCRDKDEFDRILFLPASAMTSEPSYERLMADVRSFERLPRHEVRFTHGDLAAHNILVTTDGRVSAFLDWECAGWYPEYWEYTTSWAIYKPDNWWVSILRRIGATEYEREQPGDFARRCLGSDAGTFGW